MASPIGRNQNDILTFTVGSAIIWGGSALIAKATAAVSQFFGFNPTVTSIVTAIPRVICFVSRYCTIFGLAVSIAALAIAAVAGVCAFASSVR